jgi:hypothetical protein
VISVNTYKKNTRFRLKFNKMYNKNMDVSRIFPFV